LLSYAALADGEAPQRVKFEYCEVRFDAFLKSLAFPVLSQASLVSMTGADPPPAHAPADRTAARDRASPRHRVHALTPPQED